MPPCHSRKTDPPGFASAHALDSSWGQSTDQTPDREEDVEGLGWGTLPRCCMQHEPGSAWCPSCLGPQADQGQAWEENSFSFGRLGACEAMKSWTSSELAHVHLLSHVHQCHQGVPLASGSRACRLTPLCCSHPLLCCSVKYSWDTQQRWCHFRLFSVVSWKCGEGTRKAREGEAGTPLVINDGGV